MVFRTVGRAFATFAQPLKKPQIATPPPSAPPPPPEKGDFYIKVTTYEVDPDCKKVKRLTGYSKDSEIIPNTMEYCSKFASQGNSCARPIVLTTTKNTFANCVVVDHLQKHYTYVHWFR